jgi:phosphocarrier protein HPr
MSGWRDQGPTHGAAQGSAQDQAQDLSVEDCGCPSAPIPEGALVREMLIVNRKGLHARATAKFVQCAEIYDAAVQVTRCGETVGGTSIMGILTLGAGIGTTITVTATGEQAQQALDALGALVANRFGEEE